MSRPRRLRHPTAFVVAFSMAAFLALGPAGCSRRPESDPDLVARVGSREIRRAEVEEALTRRAVADSPAARSALLEELVSHAALVEAARAAGLDRDPELLRNWENLLVAKLRDTRLEPRLTNAVPTEDAIRERYTNSSSALTRPAMRHGAVITLLKPAKAQPAAVEALRNRVAEARRRALELPPGGQVRGFGALAVEFSEDQTTRYRGGDLGWLRVGQQDNRVEPPVLDALFALGADGAVSEVVETARAFYLVRRLEAREAEVPSLETVAPRLRHELLMANRERIEAAWKKEAREATRIETFPQVLEGLRPKPAAGSSGTAVDAPPPSPR